MKLKILESKDPNIEAGIFWDVKRKETDPEDGLLSYFVTVKGAPYFLFEKEGVLAAWVSNDDFVFSAEVVND